MLISTLAVAVRDRERLQEISAAVSRFGLGVLLARVGLENGAGDTDTDERTLPRRLRQALEELGPTFVKLGQILATRADLLGPEWITELEQLHSRAPTLPFPQLRPLVEAALGMAVEEAFAGFEVEPLAAASMAQVHRATLMDGTAVVAKIQRPGIRPRMEADIRLLTQLAAVIERSSAAARRYQPVTLVRQLADGLLAELDFTNEARNAELLRADFADDPRVVVPAIHPALTSPTLLVMDFVDGVVPRDADMLRAAGLDPAAIASLGADMVLDMVLINGRFHGDPHPGNLLCLPRNRIALLDLGLIGHVSRRRQDEFLAFGQAVTTGDAALLADVLGTWSIGGGVSRASLARASERLIGEHGGRLVIGPLIRSFLTLMREEGLIMPPDLMLMFKALLTMDGVLSAIEPEFDLSGAMRRAMVRVAGLRLAPDHWLPLVRALGIEIARLGDDAPRLLRSAVRRLEAEPAAPVEQGRTHTMREARLIAAAILIGCLMITIALIAH